MTADPMGMPLMGLGPVEMDVELDSFFFPPTVTAIGEPIGSP